MSISRPFFTSAVVWVLCMPVGPVLAEEQGTKKGGGSIDMYFSPDPALLPAIVKEILAARQSIDIAMYSLSIETIRVAKPTAPDLKGKSKEERTALQKTYQEDLKKHRAYRERVAQGRISIYDALAEAIDRGVKVRMAFNEGHLGEWKNFQSQDLKKIGIDLRTTTWTMHEKFGIFDGKTLATGSANWSTTGAMVYNESTFLFRRHPEMVTPFQGEFDRIWERAKPYPPEENAKPAKENPPSEDGSGEQEPGGD